MGKQVFFIMIVALIGGMTWFVFDVDVAEMKAFVGQTETFIPPISRSKGEALCAAEAAELGLDCPLMEERILASTLRIEIRTWIVYVEGEGYKRLFSNGHGTVMEGRYLLTHNHFDLPLLELLADGKDGEFATITLYTAAGEILWQGSLTTAAVAFDDTETLLLALEDRDGRGLFESLGLPSANFETGETASLAPGATVAQINWDERQAHIQWAQVQATFDEAGTPVARLGQCLVPGASGGGVFLDGIHVANNWSRSLGCRDTGQNGGQQHSTVALNSAELLASAR